MGRRRPEGGNREGETERGNRDWETGRKATRRGDREGINGEGAMGRVAMGR